MYSGLNVPTQLHAELQIDETKQARKLQATLVRNYDSLADGGEV